MRHTKQNRTTFWIARQRRRLIFTLTDDISIRSTSVPGTDREPHASVCITLVFGFLEVTGTRAVFGTSLISMLLIQISCSDVKSSFIYNVNLETIYLYIMFKAINATLTTAHKV
ncbi:hypothetical protein BDR07DRAFT_994677 [Suillus spraguei]|nr:hypothetical protein BDR07DRAFT_994677 [Suillus spraguei]